jgi:hypothetical protein
VVAMAIRGFRPGLCLLFAIVACVLAGCAGGQVTTTTTAIPPSTTTVTPASTTATEPASTTSGTSPVSTDVPTTTSSAPTGTTIDAATLAKRKVITELFYWYDPVTGGHINRDPDDVLSLHLPGNRLPNWRDLSWFKTEFSDMMDAGIDIATCSYWQGEQFSTAGTANAVKALDQLRATGKEPPRLAMFYETLPFAGKDLTTVAGKRAFYKNVKIFFDLVPERDRGLIDGRAVLWLYNVFPGTVYDASTFDYLHQQFKTDFGIDLYIVADQSWLASGPLPVEGSYTWGVAYMGFVPTGTVAGAGPGMDDHLLPSRKPGTIVPREDGAYYERNLYYALASGKNLLWLETWNEHHEASNINDTAEYGRKYIEISRKYVDMFKRGEVPPKPELGPLSKVSGVAVEAPDNGAPVKGDLLSGGLTLLFKDAREGDGLWKTVDAAGRSAWQTTGSGSGRYLYFDIAEDFAWFDAPVTVDITVEYLDSGGAATAQAASTTALEMNYDNFQPDREMTLGDHYRTIKVATLGTTGQWKTATVRLTGVRFADGENGGADFRLWAGENRDLAVGKVTVTKIG